MLLLPALIYVELIKFSYKKKYANEYIRFENFKLTIKNVPFYRTVGDDVVFRTCFTEFIHII